MVDADQVSAYLEAHPEFLENHVLEHVPVEQLERWLIRRSQREKNKFLQVNGPSERKISLSRWKFCVHADKRQMLQGLMTSLATQPQPSRVLWELSCCIASAVGADGFILHLLDPHTGNLRQHRTIDCRQGSPEYDKAPDEDNEDEDVSDSQPMTVAFHVAQNKETLRIKDARQIDSRFPNGTPCLQQGGVHVLAAPVLQSDGTLSAVLELYRTTSREDGVETFPDRTFHEEDEEIVTSYLVWGGIALHYADLYHALKKQRDLHQFLLTVVKAIFQDMVSMDSVIAKVMTFAQRLVHADRASLFLVDNKSRELYARIFDMGNGVTEKVAQEIRFPIGTGIAGQVALTGEVLNIPDAYQDPRFNRAVDQQTGYHTRSILCMPIFSRNQVIGVVQMVNKYHGTFNQEDEESFELFAVYCGLALHHAKLYDRVRRSEQKYRVALEVLSYHNTCSDEETQLVKEELTFQNAPLGIDQFWFSAFSIDDLEKVRCAVFMFVDLFGLTRFDQNSLVKFTLTVRKNYRRVPYHNWTHGFAVANTMYTILKKAPGIFTPLEALALFVGSLCHDLDHRGKNNKFMLETASPLAAIYTTSTMEHHHFNQTVTILQQEGHNIFSKLGSEEYKQVLSNIKHCILATDLAVFFPNRAKLASVVETGSFAWDNSDHRFLVEAIAMTAADLSASSKPWDIQAETVKVIFDEFYEQGDIEKVQGKIPPPMMDRSKPHLQPDSQVGFISGICIPCYGLLQKLIPETKPLLDGCESNLKRWKELAEENENIQPQDEPANPEPTQKTVVVNPQPNKVDFEFLEEFE